MAADRVSSTTSRRRLSGCCRSRCWPGLWPAGRAPARLCALAAIALATVVFGIFVFTAASEFVFWNEFSSRFNFIAVDYLIYTREVIGNIRESYRLTPILLGLAAVTAVVVALAVRPLWRAVTCAGPGFGRRSLQMAGYVAVALASYLLVPSTWKEFSSSVQSQQLAGNGHWEFFHAFNTNEIDYDRFYATIPIEQAYKELREEFTDAGPVEFTGDSRAADRARDPWRRAREAAERRADLGGVAVGRLHGRVRQRERPDAAP